MRLAILLASVALATPALAAGSGYPGNRNVQHAGNPNHYAGCGGRTGKHCGKQRGIPVAKLPHLSYGAKRAKPPKLVYQPVLRHWDGPPKGVPVGHLPNVNFGQNSNTNTNQNSNTNSNLNRNSARAGALAGAAAIAGATAGASATGGNASIGDVITGPSTATASTSNSNNADNSSNLSSSVSVEGDTYIQARNRRIPVSTAYAAPLTSGIDTCLGSASAGVQTGILGVSLGGTKRDRICETIKLSRELHHMGMREGAVQLLCIDERVRFAMRNAGTPCEDIIYAPPPMAYDEPPPPPVDYAPPPPKRRRGERG